MNNLKKQKNNKTQKGITLIALIITIIVMLILVTVSINIAVGNGLFKSAQGAAQNTQKDKENEKNISSGMVNIDGVNVDINEYVMGLQNGSSCKFVITIPENFSISVGEIIEEGTYEYPIEENTTWGNLVQNYPDDFAYGPTSSETFGRDYSNVVFFKGYSIDYVTFDLSSGEPVYRSSEQFSYKDLNIISSISEHNSYVQEGSRTGLYLQVAEGRKW